MSCIWIVIGRNTAQNWVRANDGYSSDVKENWDEVYIDSFYFIMTTITTVGYGDMSYQTTGEIMYVMLCEFVGLCFFSFLMGSINSMLSGT